VRLVSLDPISDERVLTACRDKYVLNPLATGPKHIAMLEFLGRLMAVAIRSRNPLALDLPSLVWKPLVRERDIRMRDLDLGERRREGVLIECVGG
jgi:hypothetical protein